MAIFCHLNLFFESKVPIQIGIKYIRRWTWEVLRRAKKRKCTENTPVWVSSGKWITPIFCKIYFFFLSLSLFLSPPLNIREMERAEEIKCCSAWDSMYVWREKVNRGNHIYFSLTPNTRNVVKKCKKILCKQTKKGQSITYSNTHRVL
jgi:hypothetical protein